jgi:hypothetical protein
MSDHDIPAGAGELEAITSAMARMAADQSRLRAENAAMADRLARLEHQGGGSGSAGPTGSNHRPSAPVTSGGSNVSGGSAFSRRSAFKAMGAAAAAGAGVALGASVLAADPAAAAVEYVKLSELSDSDATTNIVTTAGYGFQGTTSDATAAGIGGQDTSTGGIGVQAQSTNGLGLVAQGGLAPLQLTPAATTGPPASGTHGMGEVYVDSTGEVFVCTASGAPGTWQRFTPAAPSYDNALDGSLGAAGSVNLLSTPIRIYDTRPSGFPLHANSGVVVTVAGQTVGGVTVPPNVVGVIGNITVVNPSGQGWITIFAAAETAPPDTSNINFQTGDIARANFCVVRLNGGEMIIYALDASTDVVFDVTGFIF